MTTTVWHNPRCSKSRLTVALLEEHDIEPEIRLYLDDAPTATELTSALTKLRLSAWELLRRGEKIFKELGLNQHSTEEAIIAAMVEVTGMSLAGDAQPPQATAPEPTIDS